MDLTLEHRLRAAAFAWLDEQVTLHGEALDAALLRRGFDFEGQRVPLAVQQGIHKPRFLDGALSLRTSINSPYQDHWADDDTLVYRYQGDDPSSWDNRAARFCHLHQLPLVYLHAVTPKPSPRYAVVWPVRIVEDHPADLSFHLQVPLATLIGAQHTAGPDTAQAPPLERAYSSRLVRTRLHQTAFRERVLRAYRQQCAMCRLRHTELLDAAHIVPDADPTGEPLVTNGLSLCRIHHGAFDKHILAVDPATYRITVRPSILEEKDGPMLRHGIQALHGVRLQLPSRVSDRPDPARLTRHWDTFRSVI